MREMLAMDRAGSARSFGLKDWRGHKLCSRPTQNSSPNPTNLLNAMSQRFDLQCFAKLAKEGLIQCTLSMIR